MTNHTYTKLAILSILQEYNLQVDQIIFKTKQTFSKQIQDKSKKELLDIKLYLLERLQYHYQNPVFASVCKQMLSLVDEQIAKQKE